MFPAGYFSSRYFPARYWPKAASLPVARPPAGTGSLRARFGCGSIPRRALVGSVSPRGAAATTPHR
jgi:hypothetical protein